MENLRAEKDRLREQVQTIIDGFEESYIESSNTAIEKGLLAMEAYRTADTIFSYVSSDDKLDSEVSVSREVDTRGFIVQAIKDGKTVCVPICHKKGIMHAHVIKNLSELNTDNLFGLLEPNQDTPRILPQDIDFVVAPCMAVDKKGNRLGRGGGYYDRFLSQIENPVVCVCRDKIVYDKLPAGKHDRPVDMVLSEKELYIVHKEQA